MKPEGKTPLLKFIKMLEQSNNNSSTNKERNKENKN